MNIWEKIKLWTTSISKVVKFIMDKVGEAKALKEKQENFKTWVDWVIALIGDALQYAAELEALVNPAPVKTKGVSVKAVKKEKAQISTNYKTAFFREKAETLNKQL